MLINEFKISYSPKDENGISKLAKKLDCEDLNSIIDIKENSISFRTIYIYESEESIEAKVFIINSTKQNLNFEYLPLKIINKDKEVVASEYIKLVDIGEIPPMNIRPFSIFFSKNSLIVTKIIDEQCSVVMEHEKMGAKISNRTAIEHIDNSIPLYDKRIIEKYVENMPPIIKNNFKINHYKSGIDEERNIFSILILSNGYDKNLELTNLNMIYMDEGDIIQAKKRIKKSPTVKANSTSVIKIILNKDDIIKETFNPEKCKVTFA